MADDEFPKFIPFKAALALVPVGETTLRRAVKDKHVVSSKPCGRRLIDELSLADWVKGRDNSNSNPEQGDPA